jgi:hypothetical protein
MAIVRLALFRHKIVNRFIPKSVRMADFGPIFFDNRKAAW